MERRLSRRISVSFKTEIISGGTSYSGITDNLSEKGINIITSPAEPAIDVTPGTSLKLNFLTDNNEILNLQCTVKWSNKNSPFGLANRIGMEIIDPPWKKSNYFL